MWTQLRIGTNTISDTTGVIKADPAHQIIGLELGNDGKLLLSIDVYGAGGAHEAKLRRNAWVFGDQTRYDFTCLPTRVGMTEKATGRRVVDAELVGPGRIDIVNGDLYSPGGAHIEITPEYLRVDGTLFKGNLFNALGTAIAIGSTGLRVGTPKT